MAYHFYFILQNQSKGIIGSSVPLIPLLLLLLPEPEPMLLSPLPTEVLSPPEALPLSAPPNITMHAISDRTRMIETTIETDHTKTRKYKNHDEIKKDHTCDRRGGDNRAFGSRRTYRG